MHLTRWNMQHLIWASGHHWPLTVDQSNGCSSLGNGCDSTHLMLGSILWGRSSLQMRKLRHSKIKSKNQNGSLLSQVLTASKSCFSGNYSSGVFSTTSPSVVLLSYPEHTISITVTLETWYYLSCVLDQCHPRKYTTNHDSNLKHSRRQFKKTRKKRVKLILIIYITQLNILNVSTGS